MVTSRYRFVSLTFIGVGTYLHRILNLFLSESELNLPWLTRGRLFVTPELNSFVMVTSRYRIVSLTLVGIGTYLHRILNLFFS